MKVKPYPLLLLVLIWIRCTDAMQEKTIRLGREIARTPITSPGFDSLMQAVDRLAAARRSECIANLSDREEETAAGLLKQEQLLQEILPFSTKKNRKRILWRLVVICDKQDRNLEPDAGIKGIRYIDRLEKEHTLTQDEKWYLSKIKAGFLNQQHKQAEYLPIWFRLLKEHRAAKRNDLITEDLYTIASHLMKLGDTDRAISFYQEAYQVAKEENRQQTADTCLASLAWLLCENKQYKEALAYFQKMDSAVSFPPSLYNTLIKCYMGINRPDSARYVLTHEPALKNRAKILFNNQVAETYIMEGKDDSASIFLRYAFEAFRSNAKRFEKKNAQAHLPVNFLSTYSLYAELLQKKGKTKQAEEAYSFIEPLLNAPLQSLNWKEKQIEAITRYSAFCRIRKQYEKALWLLGRRDSLQHIYNVMKKKQEHANLINRFEIDELSHRIEMQDKELEYSKTLNQILLCAGIIAVLLLTVLYLLFKSRKAQMKKLYNQQEQLQKLEENRQVRQETADPSRVLFLHAEKTVRTGRLFLKNDLTIEKLADLLDSNRTYLSASINEHTGKSYSVWLNDFRIQYAIGLMHDDPAVQLKCLAPQCGFSSNETFYKNFKQRCGITPGQYLNQMMLERRQGGANP